jgi:hypothetical protein
MFAFRWAIQALYWGYIRYNKGLYVHGIFRESGNNDSIQMWKEMFEDDLVDDFVRNHSYENPFIMLNPNDVSSLFVRVTRISPFVVTSTSPPAD